MALEVKDDPEGFAEFIREALKSMDALELGGLFSVSGSIVNRWKQGQNTPHPLFQERVRQVLSQKLGKESLNPPA